ncbi:MAG: hypothetical protein RRA92_10280 [Gemmatimonadota bacterium]|nr:hypothetical protein [Gemmatimonadota bacterium]
MVLTEGDARGSLSFTTPPGGYDLGISLVGPRGGFLVAQTAHRTKETPPDPLSADYFRTYLIELTTGAVQELDSHIPRIVALDSARMWIALHDPIPRLGLIELTADLREQDRRRHAAGSR